MKDALVFFLKLADLLRIGISFLVVQLQRRSIEPTADCAKAAEHIAAGQPSFRISQRQCECIFLGLIGYVKRKCSITDGNVAAIKLYCYFVGNSGVQRPHFPNVQAIAEEIGISLRRKRRVNTCQCTTARTVRQRRQFREIRCFLVFNDLVSSILILVQRSPHLVLHIAVVNGGFTVLQAACQQFPLCRGNFAAAAFLNVRRQLFDCRRFDRPQRCFLCRCHGQRLITVVGHGCLVLQICGAARRKCYVVIDSDSRRGDDRAPFGVDRFS